MLACTAFVWLRFAYTSILHQYMTIRSTFITIIVTVVMVLTLQGFVLFSYYQEYVQASQRAEFANGLIRDLLNRRFFLMEYLLRGEDSSRIVWLDVTSVIDHKISAYESAFAATSSEVVVMMPGLADIDAVHTVLKSSKQNFLALVSLREEARKKGVQTPIRTQETDLISGLLVDEQSAAGHLTTIVEEERTQATHAQASMLSLSLFIFALFVFLALTLFFFVQRNIIHPLTMLGHVAKAFAGRDFGMRVHINTKDEVGAVAAAFNQMATELESYHADLHHIISQKDMLAERTRELDMQKNKFIGAASHELKTPLTAISLYAEMLLSSARKCNDAEGEKIASELYAQAKELNALINDLLDIARLQEGRLPMHFERVDLRLCIKKALATVKGSSGHMFKVHAKSKTCVYADERKITQVIINLLVNAIKYSPNADRIDIALKVRAREVVVSVADYGIGISEEEQEKIFQQFYRGVGVAESTYPGMGIGLYFAKEVLAQHRGGRIWVESKKGRGATFLFALPKRKNGRDTLSPDQSFPQQTPSQKVFV